jgi:hypothetical protein
MRAVKRWRYYCDHCKKVSGLRTAMEKHENGCTLNPARECGICTFLEGGSATPLADLIALLPDPKQFVRKQSEDFSHEVGAVEWEEMDDPGLREATHAVLPKLRELTGDCPACILAALRQRKIPVPLIENFNWTAEFKNAQSRMADARAEQEGRYY